MKKLILIGVASLAAMPALIAQTFNVTAPGYSATSLFQTSVGHTVGGLDVDSAGNLYYLDVGPTNAISTQLVMRPSLGSGNYGAPTVLFDFGGNRKFGSFVRVNAGEIYFGENSGGTILRGTLQGTTPISATAYNPDNNPATGDYAGNYDFAFSGATAYLVADLGFAVPHVYQFNLSTGVLTSKVNAAGEFAGPLAFRNVAGNLLYGASGTNSTGGQGAANLYRFLAGSLSGSEQTLAAGNILADNDRNGYLAYHGGNLLYQDSTVFDASFNPLSTLLLYNLSNGAPTTIGGTPLGDALGNLADGGGALFATVSTGSGATGRSAIYLVVPEPSAGLLVNLGCLSFFGRRFRRMLG